MTDVFIYDALRTPRGRGKAGKGGLSHIHPQELLAQTLNTMAARDHLDKNLVEDVGMGCVTQVKEQGSDVARLALIAAQWPEDVTGYTVNRFCGSGLEAINTIAGKIGGGFIDGGIGGGVESMSRVTMGSDGAMLDGLNEKLRKRMFLVPQGISADLIATREGISRKEIDAFALASQQKAARAIEAKAFAKSLFAVKNDDGSVALDRDEHPRADTTADTLAGLQASFVQLGATPMGPNGETLDQLALKVYPDTKEIHHVHTPGNSSGIVDGASLVAVGNEKIGDELGLKPRARIVATAVTGTEPTIMLTGPAPASKKALAKAGLSLDDIDLIEMNEAFAAVVLRFARDMAGKTDEQALLEKINVNGGAIAMGHPLGATGGMILGTLVDELQRTGGRYGLATLCIGGGMGIATVVEAL